MRRVVTLLELALAASCTQRSADTPPVALPSDAPVRYPPDLFDRGIDGDVVLRLFVDAGGRPVPESITVVTTSGYPAFDSAAIHGAAQMRFKPAARGGTPVAMAFLQPIQFRHKGQP